jgi:hypothetical protein
MLTNQHSAGRDLAPQKAGGLPLHELERFLSDMENEPAWRESADKCADYYDHKQTTPERIARSAETGEPNLIINLVQRTINGALGQEAKTRLNWKVDPDADAWADVAAVLNEKLHEAQREARTDMAISEAYSSMLRAGIGWVEVSSATNPLDYPHRCNAVHRNEVFWDWRAKMPDKSDAAWMLRQRWVDLEEIVTMMPQFREQLEMGTMSGPITDSMMRNIITSDKFEDALNTRHSFNRAQEEWLDNSVRNRIRMYSVYYKQHKQVVALAVGTKRVRFNPKNPGHAALLQMGEAKLIKGPGFDIRHAMFAGPFRLFDEVMPHQRFPLIPFVCYSADDDYSPYGLVHGMIEPQNEYNERRSRLLWLLEAKQVMVDNDALDERFNTLQDVALEAMRPDAMFVLNANRRNANGLKIDMNPQLGSEQQAVMQDAYNLIQDVPGLFSPQYGGTSVGAKSGVALNSLMEQSTTSLGETSDNYRMSRQLVGEALVDQIILDHTTPNMRVMVGSGRKRRQVILNTVDQETGMPMNTMEDANVKVALGDVPSTAAFKAQQQVFLSNALQVAGNDPIARAVLLPALIEAGDTEHRAEAAKWLRQQYGVPDFNDVADDNTQAQAEQQQQQAQAEQQQLEQRGAMATIAKTEAEALKTQAQAAREQALAQREGIGNAMQTQALMQPPPQPEPTEDELIAQALQEASMPA